MSCSSDTDSLVLEGRHAGKYVFAPSSSPLPFNLPSTLPLILPSPGCSRVLVFYPGPLFSLPSHVNSKIWTCNSPWGSILYGKERTQDVTLWHGHVRFLWVLQELGIQWQETIKISKSLLSLHLVVPTFIRSKGVQWKVHLDPRSGRHEGVKQSSFPDQMRTK